MVDLEWIMIFALLQRTISQRTESARMQPKAQKMILKMRSIVLDTRRLIEILP